MTHIKTAVCVLITAMILSLVLTYASIMTLIQTTKDNTQRVLDSYVMHNSKQIFDSIKQGKDFSQTLDENVFYNLYCNEISLKTSNRMLINASPNGDVIYKITVPNVSYAINHSLNLTAKYQMYIPIKFAGADTFDIAIPISVQSRYNNLYGTQNQRF